MSAYRRGLTAINRRRFLETTPILFVSTPLQGFKLKNEPGVIISVPPTNVSYVSQAPVLYLRPQCLLRWRGRLKELRV